MKTHLLALTPILAFFLTTLSAQAAPPFVTYAGQVASGGQPYTGTGQFKFAFVNADANITYWSQDGTSSAGSQPTGQVSTTVNGGYYSILLGNTAITGMGAIDPTIFKTHSDVHLRVWFSDGVAPFQEMTPHRPFASVPYALNAGVSPGSINKSMLGADVLTDLNRTVDKSMLAQEVLNDLNATPSTGSITKSMLSSEVLTDLNRTQSVVGTSDDAFTEGLRAYLRPMLAGGVWHSWGLPGMPVTLKAPKVDGRFLTYQWYKGGSPISGATGTEYVIPDFNATRDAGDYEIRVSNAFATLKTKAVLHTSNSISSFSAGGHTVFSKSDGTAYLMGPNGNGQLGDGTTTNRNNPVQVSGLSNVSKVFAGYYHTILLKTDGTVWAMGKNNQGQLGDGSTTGRSSPFQVPGLTNVSDVSAAADHTILLKTDGTVWSMGSDDFGQMGDAGSGDHLTASQVTGLTNVAQLSAGYYHNLFVKTDGTVWGSGYGGNGQLGPGSSTAKYIVSQINGLSNITQVSTGLRHSIMLKTDGTVLAMGLNDNGQLGDGTTTSRSTPIQIPGLANVMQVSAGDSHTIILKADGTVWGMGKNSSGQLGDGSTSNRLSPVQISGLTGVSHISAGTNHTLFLKTDGTLWGMGTSGSGQLGNAGTSNVPVQLQNVVKIPEEQPFAPESVSDVVQSERPSSQQSTHVVQSAANLEMLWVEPGTFTMGSPTGEAGRSSSETEHNVTLTKGFYLGKYEVTQAQYEAVMTGNTNSLSATPSQYSGNPNRPVEKVSWDDAQVFLTRLNAAEQAAGRLPAGWSYVLPTESQWEYACRAGTTTVYSWGNTITSANANYNNTIGQTADVGQYAANPWGFFDMHGNVFEWTADWYGTYPTGNPVIDPTGVASGSYRVGRGGSWYADGTILRSALRGYNTPSYRSNYLGFRVGFQQQ